MSMITLGLSYSNDEEEWRTSDDIGFCHNGLEKITNTEFEWGNNYEINIYSKRPRTDVSELIIAFDNSGVAARIWDANNEVVFKNPHGQYSYGYGYNNPRVLNHNLSFIRGAGDASVVESIQSGGILERILNRAGFKHTEEKGITQFRIFVRVLDCGKTTKRLSHDVEMDINIDDNSKETGIVTLYAEDGSSATIDVDPEKLEWSF